MSKYKKYNKPYPTIVDLIKGKNYDYVSYRLNFKGEYEFSGCFKVEKGEIIPLDGDTYDKYEESYSIRRMEHARRRNHSWIISCL